MRRFESEVVRHFVLKAFDRLGKEFDHSSAHRTDHVVVMVVIVMMFEIRFVVAESDLASKAGLSEQFERPIDRRVADRVVVFANQAVEILDGEVVFGAKESRHYEIALTRTPEPQLLDMLEENVFLALKALACGCHIRPVVR